MKESRLAVFTKVVAQELSFLMSGQSSHQALSTPRYSKNTENIPKYRHRHLPEALDTRMTTFLIFFFFIIISSMSITTFVQQGTPRVKRKSYHILSMLSGTAPPLPHRVGIWFYKI